MARVDIHNLEMWQQLARRSEFQAARLSLVLRISRRQLQRYTRTVFGLSPQDWLNQSRLDLAAGMLKESRCVKSVALDLGFKQCSHFSREFKKRHGLSPVAYLSNARDPLQNPDAVQLYFPAFSPLPPPKAGDDPARNVRPG